MAVKDLQEDGYTGTKKTLSYALLPIKSPLIVYLLDT